ncbi:MAG: Mov34/MPN/PAD-1 family protein [Streptosporangiaceae bacterium]
MAFLDSVLKQIEEHIARFPPERGGALLGPVGQPLVTEFIFDPEARTSGVTFTPSRALADRVRARESADQQIELKGILHSHPGDMGRPSQGDHYAYEDSLEGAPWLGRLVAPIVTIGTRLRREHDVPLPSGTMSVYIAERRPDAPAGVVVEPAEPHVLRISRDLKSLASALGGTAEPPFVTDIGGQLYVAGVVGCEGFDLQVLVGPAYPFTPPVVIAARRPEAKGDLAELRLGLLWNGDSPASQGLRLAWDLETPDETRLLAALLAAGQAPDAPTAALAALVAGQAALVAGQAALVAGQAALTAGQAALAAGQAALAAEQPEPEAELEAESQAEEAGETEPGGQLVTLAVDEAGPEAEETESGAAADPEPAEPGAEDPEPAEPGAEDPEPAEPDAELGEPDAEPAESQANDAELQTEDAEPEAGHAPHIGPDTPDRGPIGTASRGWFGRLLQWIKRLLNPRSWRRRAAARPAVATDGETDAVPEAITGDDAVAGLVAVQGTGQADD